MRPVLGAPRYQTAHGGLSSENCPRDISLMSTANALRWTKTPATERTETSFGSCFENAPVAVARCSREGVITEMNPAFERSLGRNVASRSSLPLRFHELVSAQDRSKADSLLHDLFNGCCSDGKLLIGDEVGQMASKWIAWRQPGFEGEPDHALLMAQQRDVGEECEIPAESLLQTQRWEAIGRLAGGIVHDFNNLLTGVMLYSDLLLSSLDLRDRRRRYGEEIRSAIVQASGLMQQLLVFARPQQSATGPLSFNEVAEAMCDMLKRLIGENIILELRLDRQLGAVEIAPSQAQQVLLNLVLNARDALPKGGRIAIGTSNCGFHPVAKAPSPASASAFPCILLEVSDNGRGMSSETRRRLFEPF